MAIPLKDRLAACRAAIKADLQAVLPSGTPVYDYFRDINNEAVRNSIAKDSGGKLHVWMMTLADQDPTVVDFVKVGHSQGHFNFLLYGYLATKDAAATEITFDAECCDVIDKFITDKYLGGNALNAWPVSRVQGGWVQFANVLCHRAVMSMPVLTQVEC
jgi:hypothetical protein